MKQCWSYLAFMVLCILVEVTNIHLSQYKQNKSDSNSNNDGDNSKNNKMMTVIK